MNAIDLPTQTTSLTLDQVISRVLCNKSLRETRQRDLVSACTSLARMLGEHPSDIIADAATLRSRIADLHPAEIRCSSKRLTNIKSDLTAAFMRSGAMPKPHPDVPLGEDWSDFLGSARAVHQARAITRFAKFCMARGTPPHAVRDKTIDAYRDYIHPRILAPDPEKLCKETVQTWNRIVRDNGSVLRLLTPIRKNVYRARPLDDYPDSLRKDLESYVHHNLERPSIFDPQARRKPLRPTSIINIRAHVRQHLDAAVQAGHPPDRFKSLADLIQSDVITSSFGMICTRLGSEAPLTLNNICHTLVVIAKYHVKPDPETLDWLKGVKSSIAERSGAYHAGMTDKNMERLDQFDDWNNVLLLAGLPGTLVARALKNPDSARAQLYAMYGIAIAIQLSMPLRAANLAALRIGDSFRLVAKGSKRRYQIRIRGENVKNKNPIDIDLGAAASGLIQKYLEKIRPRLHTQPDDALFPRPTGGPRAPKHLGEDIKGVIRRETGLIVNVHLFRALAGMLFLRRNPGQFEVLRRLLGHRKMQTTLDFYDRFNANWAAELYDETVLTPIYAEING